MNFFNNKIILLGENILHFTDPSSATGNMEVIINPDTCLESFHPFDPHELTKTLSSSKLLRPHTCFLFSCMVEDACGYVSVLYTTTTRPRSILQLAFCTTYLFFLQLDPKFAWTLPMVTPSSSLSYISSAR